MSQIINDLEQGIVLWSDVRLPENVMNYLWMIINSPTRTDVIREDGEDLSSFADFKTDKDDWFFENVMKKECIEILKKQINLSLLQNSSLSQCG